MPPDPHYYDVQTALEGLRAEIQRDRLAMSETITDGFTGLHKKLDEQTADFGALEVRIATVEDRMDILGKGLWSLWVSFVGSVVAGIVTFIFGKH